MGNIVNTAKGTHPTQAQLGAFLEGRLEPAAQAETERHIAECAQCCQALAKIPDDTLAGHLRAGSTQVDAFANIEHTAPLEDADQLPAELRDHPRYRVFKLLGKGGMGEVYLAEHRLMARMVALKVIRRGITQDPQAVERFRNEVKAAARLSHPNIVAAHDAEQAGDAHFLVMEFIDGISLDRLVEKRGRLAVAQACHYVRQAALGLQHAVDHGMIHRDIKPQNLMLTRKGHVKILDFGLARFARDPSNRITELGVVLGTPDYIAPEQVTNSRHADIRADIYSLGCTLYYLLAGQTPFPTGTQTQKIIAHVDRDPQPLAQVRSDLPRDLIGVIEKMMAKDPDERFGSPREVAHALLPFTKTSEAPIVAAAPTAKKEVHAPTQARRRTSVAKQGFDKRWLLLAALPVVAMLLGSVLLVGFLVANRSKGPKKDNDFKGNEIVGVDRKAPRVLMVLNHKGFWNPDYRPVRAVLEENGIEVKVASTDLSDAFAHDNWGGPAKVDTLIHVAREADFEALYFAGAKESDFVGDKPAAVPARKLIKDMLAADKLVASQGAGVFILADGGFLQGKRATLPPQIKWKVNANAARWDPEARIVEDGNFITGGDFKDGPELAAAIVKRLRKK